MLFQPPFIGSAIGPTIVGRDQAIGRAGTFTSQGSQHCRLLLSHLGGQFKVKLIADGYFCEMWGNFSSVWRTRLWLASGWVRRDRRLSRRQRSPGMRFAAL